MDETRELTLKQLSSQHFVPVGWYQNLFNTDITMEWHHHRQFEIMYCQRGAFAFEYMPTDDENTVERISVPEKYFIFVNTGYYHKISVDVNGTQIFNVELLPENSFGEDDSKLLKSLSPNARDIFTSNRQLEELREEDAPFYVLHDSGDVGLTMKSLVEELDTNGEPAKSLSARLLSLKLLFDIAKCRTSKNAQPIKLRYVRNAVQFMQKNFANPVTVKEIADSVELSPAYLQRLFKEEFKKGIHSILTAIRVTNAKNLLQTTSLPNREIAKLSGFTSREQLIYSFRALEGCSPHEYRLAYRSKNIRAFPWPTDTKLPQD